MPFKKQVDSLVGEKGWDCEWRALLLGCWWLLAFLLLTSEKGASYYFSTLNRNQISRLLMAREKG